MCIRDRSKFDISFPQELLKITDTIVVCAVGNRYAGYLLLADALKEDAKVAIDRLKALNIENIQILSGDKQSIVSNFAEKLGISEAYGDLLPDGKVKHLEELLAEKERLIKVYEKLVEGKNEIYSWNNMSYYFFTVMCLQ